MTTTASDVIARARGYSVWSDSSLTNDSSEMLSKINAIQNAVFARVAAASRYFYTTGALTSTSGSSGRTADTSAITGIERIVHVYATAVPDALFSRVDWEDQDSELPPRYVVKGTTLCEVSNDWQAATGTVALTVGYAKQATQLDPTGALTQAVTLPDAYADLLSVGLAEYIARKDPGRDSTEADALAAQFGERLQNVILSLDHFGGTARRRFLSPETEPPETPGGSA